MRTAWILSLPSSAQEPRSVSGASGAKPPLAVTRRNQFLPRKRGSNPALDLRTGDDQPVNYELNETKDGVVLSFRPDPKRFKEGSIGDYQLVFDASSRVKPDTKYRVGTRLEVSDYRYQQHLRYGQQRKPGEGPDYGDPEK